MKRQKNVQQQIGDRRRAIVETARAFIDHPEDMAWLRVLLATHALDGKSGLLLELKSVPDQECWVHYGLWLTGGGRFVSFVADETYGGQRLSGSGVLEDSSVTDVTAETSTDEYVPGIGRSFGWLALDVMREINESR